MFYIQSSKDYELASDSNEDLGNLNMILSSYNENNKDRPPPNPPPRLRLKHKQTESPPVTLSDQTNRQVPLLSDQNTSNNSNQSLNACDLIDLSNERFNESTVQGNDKTNETPLFPEKSQCRTSITEKKLCGYLGKLSTKALIKNYRRRWFVFSPSSCKLFYFRSADDVHPLGEIDISLATFHFDAANKEKPGLFTISTQDKEYCLEAGSRQECLIWLQELQRYRRLYSQNQTFLAKGSSSESEVIIRSERPKSGLLAQNLPTESFVNDENAPESIVLQEDLTRRSPSTTSWHQHRLSSFRINNRQGSDFAASLADESFKSPRNLKARLKESFKIAEHTKSLGEERLCSKCKKEDTLSSFKDDIQTLEDELLASRELIKTLQTQLDLTLKEKETLERLVTSKEQSNKSEISLILPSTEGGQNFEAKNQINTDIPSLQQEIIDLKNQLKVYEELICENNKTIVELTNQVFELESSSRGLDVGKDESFGSYEDLLDSLQAYELQNKFLNKEIVELNLLRQNDEKRERKLKMMCNEWEARYCQTQSKMLTLLRSLDQPFSEQQKHTREMVQRLLEEAKHEPLVQPRDDLASQKDYDAFGFNWQWGKDDLLTERASNLQQKSTESDRMLWHGRWENFMVTLGDKTELKRSAELKNLVRSGIPPSFKGRIWKGCVDLWVKDLKEEVGDDYYSSLVSLSTKVMTLDPAAKQIELDLLRTLPNNCHYETLDSPGIAALRRVLLAYSRRNRSVGYCQGINRLAAIALLVMDEEDAFWCLVAIVERIMPPNYYTRSLVAAQVDQRVLKDLLTEKMPRLASHFESYKVDISLYAFNWFMTVFVDNIPVATYLRIWDAFLYEGSKVLFRFALAFIKVCETELLQITDYMALNKFLRHIEVHLGNTNRIAQIAFHDLNPFSMKMLQSKRAYHQKIVEAELLELETQRQTQISPSPAQTIPKNTAAECITSEEDEDT